MLDERVQILSGIRIERRRQDAAIAESTGAELHAALHPGHDAVLAQLRDRGLDHLFASEQVTKAQLAVFEYLLDLGRGVGRPEANGVERHALFLAECAMPGVEHRAN